MRDDLTANAAPTGRDRTRLRRFVRGLLALPLALALIAPSTALAAAPTSGYSQTQPAPKTETIPSPKGEAAPTQTSSTPTKTETSSSGKEPTATTATKASTLPFTGLDLRWVILGGVLLVGMGMSIVVVQRGRGSSANR
jgi:hypothetical protein